MFSFSHPPARFIPAYAGNSEVLSSLTALRLVHPRLRGELFDFFNVRWLNNGSSPLTRGTQRLAEHLYALSRFIPAYAGNSPSWLSPLYAMAVHPRLRGELNSLRQTASKSLGSSPLTRGTLSDDNDEIMLRRFIPAYAGNSLTLEGAK